MGEPGEGRGPDAGPALGAGAPRPESREMGASRGVAVAQGYGPPRPCLWPSAATSPGAHLVKIEHQVQFTDVVEILV